VRVDGGCQFLSPSRFVQALKWYQRESETRWKSSWRLTECQLLMLFVMVTAAAEQMHFARECCAALSVLCLF
jgi:hypothetical protein